MSTPDSYDVVIVGAGIAGMSAYYYLSRQNPSWSILVIDAKSRIGGTWDTFRYPGLRCDSDMYTYGFSFRPWTKMTALASGKEIQQYLVETAESIGFNNVCLMGHTIEYANWSSINGSWTLFVKNVNTGKKRSLRTRFLFACTGYFSHKTAYFPSIPGHEIYGGQTIVAQHWPNNLSLNDKHIALIGSGATAVSLLPELAKEAKKVTMIQRSPGYIYSHRDNTVTRKLLSSILPRNIFFRVERGKNHLLQNYSVWLSKYFPRTTKWWFIRHMKCNLRDSALNERDFTPNYAPWQQRLCVTPNREFFKCLDQANVSLITDCIQSFQKNGILMKRGVTVEADTVVYATGLQIELFGNIAFCVDDIPINVENCIVYKGALLSGMPNFIFSSGYQRASWTSKTELIAKYACRLIKKMQKENAASFMVQPPSKHLVLTRLPGEFKPGYLLRHVAQFPQFGDIEPWTPSSSFQHDKKRLFDHRLDDKYLHLYARASEC